SIAFLSSSCLKDDSMVLNPDKTHNVIEFGNTADIAIHGSVIPAYVHSYNISPTPVELSIPINFSGPEAKAPQDIKVTLTLGTAADITKYNTAQGTNYEILPATMYEVTSFEVTIPKGQMTGKTLVKFFTDKFDLSKNYALP